MDRVSRVRVRDRVSGRVTDRVRFRVRVRVRRRIFQAIYCYGVNYTTPGLMLVMLQVGLLDLV